MTLQEFARRAPFIIAAVVGGCAILGCAALAGAALYLTKPPAPMKVNGQNAYIPAAK